MPDIALPPPQPRAGFWRRWAGAVIDGIVVSVPIQLLVVVLFAMTNGAFQVNSGIDFNDCTHNVAIANLPQGLTPPPPERATRAVICHTSFFGLSTARHLIVSRITKEGIVTKTVSRSYMLDANDNPNHGVALDWLVFVTLFIYLVALEHRFGRTLGKRVLGMRVVDTQDLEQTGIPLRKAVVRNLLVWSFGLPMMAVLLGYWLLNGSDPEGMMAGSFFSWLAAAGVLGFAWALWMLIDIVRRRDPIYDRIAGTAVLHVRNDETGTAAT